MFFCMDLDQSEAAISASSILFSKKLFLNYASAVDDQQHYQHQQHFYHSSGSGRNNHNRTFHAHHPFDANSNQYVKLTYSSPSISLNGLYIDVSSRSCSRVAEKMALVEERLLELYTQEFEVSKQKKSLDMNELLQEHYVGGGGGDVSIILNIHGVNESKTSVYLAYKFIFCRNKTQPKQE